MGTTTTPVTVPEFLAMPGAVRGQGFRSHGIVEKSSSDQPLTDPAVLPGFSIPTSAIFEGV